jgi:DNA-binding HxlR family transcriptional regulator
LSSIPTLPRRRWALPILAQLALDGGSRFVPLASRLGVSRDALRQTLDALINAGLVTRNPGYGHPSRPEYILTEVGRRVAPACVEVLRKSRRGGFEDVLLKRWSLPIVAALGNETRYGELRRALDVTPRALTLALKELVSHGLVERRVLTGFPPSTTYRLTARSRTLHRHVARLAAALGSDVQRP